MTDTTGNIKGKGQIFQKVPIQKINFQLIRILTDTVLLCGHI